jgi:hypothetical protein
MLCHNFQIKFKIFIIVLMIIYEPTMHFFLNGLTNSKITYFRCLFLN